MTICSRASRAFTTKLYTIFDYFTLFSAPLLSFLHFIFTVIANIVVLPCFRRTLRDFYHFYTSDLSSFTVIAHFEARKISISTHNLCPPPLTMDRRTCLSRGIYMIEAHGFRESRTIILLILGLASGIWRFIGCMCITIHIFSYISLYNSGK